MQVGQQTGRKKRLVFFALRVWRWIKGICLLASLLGVVLYTIGIPKSWVSSLIEWPAQQGLHLDYACVKWKITGWEFSKVMVYEEYAELRIQIHDLKVSSLYFKEASAHSPLRIELNDISIQKDVMEASSVSHVENLLFCLYRQDEAWVFSEGRVASSYITLGFEGLIEEGARLGVDSSLSDGLLNGIESFANSLKRKEDEALSGELYFSLCKEAARSSLEWHLSAAAMQIEQLKVHALSLKGKMSPQEGCMFTFEGTVDTKEILLEGVYEPRFHSLDVTFSHQIDGLDLSRCLSDEASAWLKQKGIDKVTCSPCSVQISSRGSLQELDIRFIELGTVEINEDPYELSGIYANKQGDNWSFLIELLAHEKQDKSSDEVLTCMGSYYSEEDYLDIELISSLHPHRLWRLLPMHTQLREQLLAWNTESVSPHIHIQGKLFLAEDKQDISASIQGKQLSYREVPFNEISMNAHYSGDRLKLSKIEGTKEDQSIQLDLVYDLSKGWMEYVGSAYLAYADLFTLMHVNTNIVEHIRVEDIPYSSFSGQYSLRDKKSLGYQFYTKTASVTWHSFMMDEGEIELRVDADQIKQVRAQAACLGGQIVCNGEVHPSSAQKAPTFTGHWSASHLELEQGKTRAKEHHQRRLDASGTLTYNMHEGIISSGEGEAEIILRGSQLAELPFLAGLQELLSELLPLERWFAFDQLKGSLRYKDKQFHSDNLIMSGPLMMASIEGEYDWQTGYDAIMRLQLRDDTDIEKLMSVLTGPLFRVFDINLEGTFNQPTWHLRKWDDLIN